MSGSPARDLAQYCAGRPVLAGHCQSEALKSDVAPGEGCACTGHGCGAVCDGLAETLIRRVDIEGEAGWRFFCDACATDALTFCDLYGTVDEDY